MLRITFDIYTLTSIFILSPRPINILSKYYLNSPISPQFHYHQQPCLKYIISFWTAAISLPNSLLTYSLDSLHSNCHTASRVIISKCKASYLLLSPFPHPHTHIQKFMDPWLSFALEIKELETI